MREYFFWPVVVTVAGLALGAWLGWITTGTLAGTASVFFICAVLAVLEISLSFDNAIVNANKLKTMSPVWQRRFLTWGILIAVFGMRILFPLAIVAVAASIGPWSAMKLAVAEPARYAEIMHDAHLGIAAFGGTFLMMVGLGFFFDEEKDIHWVAVLEEWLVRYTSIQGVQMGLVLATMLAFSSLLGPDQRLVFLVAAIWGLLTFFVVEVVGRVLDRSHRHPGGVVTGGLGAFLYLEVLDASFSFDGVIGAFALSQNLFVIAIGLGIGAMYVRALTIMLVDRGTLAEYRYLEHGAFYAILVLAVIMYVQTLVEVPEVLTGLAGAAIIAVAFWSSVRHNRTERRGASMRPSADETSLG